MGGMNNPEQNRKLLKNEDNLKRKNLLESTSAYNLGRRIGYTKVSAENKSQVMNENDAINRGRPEKQYNDKYKHALISCEESQKGFVEAGTIGILGLGKEIKDNWDNSNDLQENWSDLKADGMGIYQGFTNRKGNCDEMVQRKYKKFSK